MLPTTRPTSYLVPVRMPVALVRVLCLAVLAAASWSAETILIPRNADPTDPEAKISSFLRAYIDQPNASDNVDPYLARMSARTIHANQVPLRLDVQVTPANLHDITATGAHVMTSSARWNSVRVEATLAQVRALAQLPAIYSVHLLRPPIHHASPGGQPGTQPNLADSVMGTDQVRTTYGITGSGQTVGIISDSINDTPDVGPGTVTGSGTNFTLTGTKPQVSGDLPSSINVINFGVASRDGSSDEGEAMMEEIFHLAPGANYVFSTAGASDVDMATSISLMNTQAHCTVICDDVGFSDEPMFQDGPIAVAANEFVAAGGCYLSAAGNDADQGIIQTFTPVVPGANDSQSNGTPNGNDFHNWGAGTSNGFLPLVITGNRPIITVILEWNQPFASFTDSGTGMTYFGHNPGSQADYDLYLYSAPSATSANLLAASTDTQGTPATPGGDPAEFLTYNLPGNSQTVYLAVDHVRGLSNSLLRLVVLVNFGSFTSPNYAQIFGAGTCFGHPASQSVIAVAAVPYTNSTQLETFTSKGGWGAQGLPYFFDPMGNVLPNAPQLRNKPDITAPDGISVSVPNFTPFFGTSAATPNAGAVATLLRSEYPTLTGAQIQRMMCVTGTDIVNSSPPAGTGPDAWSGYGLVNAVAAIANPVISVSSTIANGSYETGTIPIQLTFASPVTVSTAGGVPSLLLNTSPPESAVYVSGSGTSTLTFAYTLVHGDLATTLDVASSGALSLNGGTIQTVATGVADVLTVPVPGSVGSLSVNNSLNVDAVGPTVTITSVPVISNQTTFTFTCTFQRDVTGFTAGNITLSNATAGTFTAVSPSTYTLAVTATAPGALSASIAANSVVDGAGYGNLAGSGSATYDITKPTLVITPAATSVRNGTTVLVTFQFSKAVTGFTAANVVLVDGQPSTVTGSGSTYTMAVTSGNAGTMTISVLSGTVSDLAGNTLAFGASASVAVTSSSSSKHCGIGSLFGILLLGGFSWYRRRPPHRRHEPA